jgi:hypothetical protein
MMVVAVFFPLVAFVGALVGLHFAFTRGRDVPSVRWLGYVVTLTGLLCAFGPLIQIAGDPDANFDWDGGYRSFGHFAIFLLVVAPVHLLFLLGLSAAAVFAQISDDAQAPSAPQRRAAPPAPRSEPTEPSDFNTLPQFPGGN